MFKVIKNIVIVICLIDYLLGYFYGFCGMNFVKIFYDNKIYVNSVLLL